MSAENRRVNLKNGSHPTQDTIVEQVELRVVGATTSNSVIAAAGKFTANASVANANVGQVIGLIGKTVVQGLTSVPNGITAALMGIMDVSGAANVASANGAYALVLDSVVGSGVRGAGATPTAFIAFGEEAIAAGNTTVSGSPVLYLFDIGRPGKSVVTVSNSTVNSVWSSATLTATSNSVTTVSNSTSGSTTTTTTFPTASGSLRLRINGAVHYVPTFSSVT